MSLYDKIAHLYDPWSASVVEDIEFYVEEARRSGGPVVELAVGTGRIAVPIAQSGIAVIGVDSSAGMLERACEYAAAKGVEHRRPRALPLDGTRSFLNERHVNGPERRPRAV